VRLSAFSILDAYPEHSDGSRDRYQEFLQLVGSCERERLSTVWVAEHHFQDAGVCPAPAVLLAAAGERARTIRLGVMVSVLPFHAPLEVAEEYALLDRLLGGRLDLGVGSGYIPMEFEGFGVDPATKRDRFDRALETILTSWRGDPVRADVRLGSPVRLNVLPLQRPHPPLWIAVQRRESIPYVARRGLNLALVPYATVASIDELASEIQEYRASLPKGNPGKVSVAVHLYAGRDPGLARTALQRFLDSRRATQSRFYLEKLEQDPRHGSVAQLESDGLVAIGSAAEVGRTLSRYRDAGVDELLGMVDFGGLTPDRVDGSVRELAAAVRPLG
jgi:alkanesulfonate monooxygenase SsuD/methylene tetrahydromethanopterin reductase-like flavin-dependent oxidoreductase (luciferase family)